MNTTITKFNHADGSQTTVVETTVTPECRRRMNADEEAEWRDMVRLFIDRGETLRSAIDLADEYINALRERTEA